MSMRTALTLTLCLLCWSVRPARAAVHTRAVEENVQALIERTRPAFVFIAGGSGAVISAEGYMISNAHVVKGQKRFSVRLGDGRSMKAELLGLDPGGDLALLKIETEEDLPHLSLGDSDALRVGSLSLAIGNPIALGLVDQTPTFTLGVVSALHQYRGIYNDAVVTDAPVNPGNSGGPLVNMAGELVGVNGLVQTRWGLRASTGLGYAVPANQIKRFLPALEAAEGGEIYRGRLAGIEWDEDEEAGDVKGARIEAVAEASDAARAGFQADDVVLRFDGAPIWHAARFAALVRGRPAGTAVEVVLRRGGEEKTLTVTLGTLKPGKLGFQLARPKAGDEHLRVDTVEEDAPAARAGLQAGDEIIAIQGTELTGDIRDKALAIARWIRRGLYAGEEIRLTVRRTVDGAPVDKELVFEAY